jgi:hypothetical protein
MSQCSLVVVLLVKIKLGIIFETRTKIYVFEELDFRFHLCVELKPRNLKKCFAN